jgi:hypothetical protein
VVVSASRGAERVAGRALGLADDRRDIVRGRCRDQLQSDAAEQGHQVYGRGRRIGIVPHGPIRDASADSVSEEDAEIRVLPGE